MDGRRYEFLIVGSGAGGATLARELSKRDKEVLVVERGKRERVGTFRDSLRFFDVTRLRTPRQSKEGVILWRTIMAGGSTVVSCGNSTRCLEAELADFGIVLDDEFAEAEQEMHVAPIAEGLLSGGSEGIMEAAQALGYRMEPMPKFLDPIRCQKCGQCVFGCVGGAKWTALDHLDEAEENGADILFETHVQRILVEDGKAKGIIGVGPQGQIDILSDVVILAAGGLGTPVILQQSGIEEAGSGLFVDLFVNTYGVTKGLNQTQEPVMALVDHEFYSDRGFILSPFVNHHRMVRLMEGGAAAVRHPARRLIGIMTKTADDPTGRVFADGTVSKPVTDADWGRLREGSAIAREILIKAGADSESIVVSRPQGAHPGGTAAVGRVVNGDLQTEVEGLFVCDASVLPTAPGMPPILTICALAKWLAKRLIS